MNAAEKELAELLAENTVYFETGFSIDLKTAPGRWYRCASALGLRESCGFMAETLCGLSIDMEPITNIFLFIISNSFFNNIRIIYNPIFNVICDCAFIVIFFHIIPPLLH